MALANKFCPQCNPKFLMSLLIGGTALSLIWYLSDVSSDSPSKHRKYDCNPKFNYELGKMQESAMEVDSTDYESLFHNKIVHLDMKGAPPKLEYLAELFPLLSKLGATGILLEYEDMFPYQGSIQGISARNTYSSATITKMNLLAQENKLEIIPLIQTFGHLEFMLKLQEYQHLREVPEQPQAICPSHNETLPLLQQMLEQVAKLHPNSKRIHIGADEVYFIGKCSSCQQRMSDHLWMPSDLFLDHVDNVATFVQQSLGLRPMMWDDHFRSLPESQLARSQIGSKIDIVVWNYGPTLDIRPDIWKKYLRVFDAVWAASAFKGATGSNAILTDIRHHMDNHLAWMALAAEYRHSPDFHKFQGVMITGWQRYDHFAVLCELLPVSLPSLASNLLLLRHGHQLQRIDRDVSRLLDCQDSFFTSSLPEGFPSTIRCHYPGAEVFSTVQYFGQLRDQYQRLLNDSVVRGWMSDYNVQHQFSSPTHLERIDGELSYLKSSLEGLARDIEMTFDTVYDRFTVKEWLDTFVKPLQASVNQHCQTTEMLRSKIVWPRRPLEN